MVIEAERDRIPFFKQYFSVIILAANIIVFIWQILDSEGQMHIEAAFFPADFFEGNNLWTLFSSMFMHGDIIHIVMNMWFFLVVTDNCEHAMGHLLFIFTYIVSGLLGSVLHALSTLIIHISGFDEIPSLRASGAIFGLMGVYLILYPRNKFIVPASIGITMRTVSAGYFIMIYFISELIYGLVSLMDPFGLGSTAHFAHIGGFIAGATIAVIF